METADRSRGVKKADARYLLILLASGIVFFVPNLGGVHLFDWDEINFAESAREMIVTGDYARVQINFQPFWEKPPFFLWLQCLSMNVFGVCEFAARLPNAIFGILTLLTLYFIGKRTVDRSFGFIWGVCYLGSILPHLYFKSGIIDPVFNYFIFLGLYFAFRAIQSDAASPVKLALLSGTFIGLSNLTKGPVGLLIFLLAMTAYWVTLRCKRIASFRAMLAFALSFSLVSFLWFGMEVIHNGPWFVVEFVKYQIGLFATPVAGHKQPLYYHFVVVFVGCFPMSILALPCLLSRKLDESDGFLKLMRLLFWVVMILFSVVTTKIVHYSSMSYLPLSYLAGVYIYRLTSQRELPARYVFRLLAIVGSVLCVLLVGVPLAVQRSDLLIPYVRHPFVVACLQSQVAWQGYEFLVGALYLAALITALIVMKRRHIKLGMMVLFYSTATCMSLYLLCVMPKIDSYYQAPAINFYKSLAGSNVDVLPVGFKSYAHYFYFQKPGPSVHGDQEEDYLLKGNIDRPAYFVTKATNTQFPKDNPACQLLKREGGYLFYSRMPKDASLPSWQPHQGSALIH